MGCYAPDNMDTDARYLKRKVKAGSLDVHPTEKALVVNYELEATILGELGDPMLGDRKECQKIIRLKSLNNQTDIATLANEVITKCKLIHPSKLPEVEQLLYYLQNRKEKTLQKSDDNFDSLRPKSASMHRYSPIETSGNVAEETANINDLEDYIELLYEDVSGKVRGSGLILQLSRNPDNLDELSQNETLLGALSRVLREEWRSSIDLTTNIIYIFFCFSTFTQFHPVIMNFKIGSQVMDILQYEVTRYNQWSADLNKRQKSFENMKSSRESEDMDREKSEVDTLDKKFQNFVLKQEQTLRVSIYLLLNLSEDIKVEEKMKRRGATSLLVQLLGRSNDELLILVISFLKKLSLYGENKDTMVGSSIIEKITPLLASENSDLINAIVRLLLNLSFDCGVRSRMIKCGMLPRLVSLLSDQANQNPVSCVLYHLSMDDKVKSMFTYTDAIPSLMKIILQCSDEQVDLEIMALAINLAANKRNAQLICEGNGLRLLMQRAFTYQDPLIIKMIRNISQHDGVTKTLFIEFIGDIADAVHRAENDEFVLECVGILGNLTLPDLDFTRLLKEFEMVNWMRGRLMPNSGEDDLILEIVVFIGTCASDESAAIYLCKSDLLPSLIDLLKAKQEDDEIVLQVVYVFYQLCSHSSSRQYVRDQTEATPYLLDLLHDRNPEVQRVCDATLQMIGEVSPEWSQKLLAEKFRFHNAQWLEMVQSQQLEEISSAFYDEEEDGLLHDSDILDIDKAELLLGQDLGLDMFSSSEDTPDEVLGESLVRSNRPMSAYRRDIIA